MTIKTVKCGKFTKMPLKNVNEFMNDGVFGRYNIYDLKTGLIHKACLSGALGEMSSVLRVDIHDLDIDNVEVLEVNVVDGRPDYNKFIACIRGDFTITYS